ncbi:hypothetical protein [Pseudomonas taetrolens]|uniref:hypothetical protein n=1 Tax=Pseudomonas taetrolens TaxID=47884 RepID=UPI003F9AE428
MRLSTTKSNTEGAIPKGYGAGDVTVLDLWGGWIPKAEPKGEKLSGHWSLVRTSINGKQEQWFL